MNPRLQAFLISSSALGLLLALLLLLIFTTPTKESTPPIPVVSTSTQSASVSATEPFSAPPPTGAVKSAKKPEIEAKNTNTKPEQGTTQAQRIENPYGVPPLSFDVVNVSTRQALVNIICMPESGSLNPISGSGVLIDPRGIILTNAHVAQYVLLSQSPQVDLTCYVRTGAPAIPRWKASVLYLPPIWVEAHVSEINQINPMGTGEHDYALLSITGNLDGTPVSEPLPYLPIDIRDGIGFLNDDVLAAAYPAEFVGGIIAQSSLYPVSSVAKIRQLLTFNTGSVDAFSIGGVIEAQAGSSGGAVVNAWNRLVGIITITSAGNTTADRDLRAITLGYVDQDMKAQTGKSISQYIATDPSEGAENFARNSAPTLIGLYLKRLSH